MKALRFTGGCKSCVVEVPAPCPAPGEVLIRIAVSAICGSERHEYINGSSQISGHEYAGTVVQANDCRLITPGDRVAVNVTLGCGRCYYCRSGMPQLCRSLRYYHGGHAEYVCVPEQCCLKLPEEMPFDIGVLLGGDGAGTPYRAVRRARCGFGNTALVTGAGPIGFGVAAFLRYYGVQTIVSEPHPERRALVQQILGVDCLVDPEAEDIKAAVEAYTGGIGPDIVFECSGNGTIQRSVLKLVRPQGTVVFVGENMAPVPIIPSEDIIHREIQVTGSFYFTRQDFIELCELYRRGFDPLVLVTGRFPLERAPEAFACFFAGNGEKILLERSL